MDRVRVNTVSLGRTKSEVSSNIGKIRNKIESLNADVTALNAMWEGEAHDAFTANFTSDIGKLSALCENLDKIVMYEDNAEREYNRCEGQVKNLVESLNV